MTCQSSSSGSQYGPGDVVALADELWLDFTDSDSSSSSAGGPDLFLLLKWNVSRYRLNVHDGIRVYAWIDDYGGLADGRVFAYLMKPVNPATLDRAGMFDHVCSPVDLDEYPADEPVPDSRPAWFRLNYVDVLVRSQYEADEFVEILRQDVQSIISTLKISQTLLPGGEELMQ